jgi:hypothetical protein
MSQPGAADILVAARRALLDALDALAKHRSALVLVGAQAIYLHTGNAPVALAESTKDSDIAINPHQLGADPLLEEAMRRAGFTQNALDSQPGSWLSFDGVPVDLMVPEQLAGAGSRRSGRIAPHGDRATRRATGLEAAVIDHGPMMISALDPHDTRAIEMNVAGPAALLVAKLHKLGERQSAPRRLLDKDAHDAYRLLVATESAPMAATLRQLRENELCDRVTNQALMYLDQLFAAGPEALGATMAGRAEELVGDPATVSASAAVLAAELLALLTQE